MSVKPVMLFANVIVLEAHCYNLPAVHSNMLYGARVPLLGFYRPFWTAQLCLTDHMIERGRKVLYHHLETWRPKNLELLSAAVSQRGNYFLEHS